MLLALITAFYVGEISSNLNKVCYYDDRGSVVAITIPVQDICPLTIKVSD